MIVKVTKSVFLLLVFSLLCALGTWQVSRYFEKEKLQEQLLEEFLKSSQDINQVEHPRPFMKIHGKGLVSAETIWMPYSHPEYGFGWRAIRVVKFKNKSFLYDAGWLPSQTVFHEETLDIEAGLLSISHRSVMSNQPQQGLWYFIDPKSMCPLLACPDNVDQFFMVRPIQQISKDAPYPLPIDIKSDVPHLQYAATWYSLAVLFLVMVHAYRKKNK